MKKRAIPIVLAVVLIFSISYAAYALKPATNIDLSRRASDAASRICESIPENEFGGIYHDGGTVYVNIVENSYSKYKGTAAEQNGVKVVYNPVKFSLQELQAATDSIFSRLNESEHHYDIIKADANDVTNMIDIEIRPASDEVYEIAAEYIDLEYVNVTVLPDDYILEFTFATEPPDTAVENAPKTNETKGTLGKIYPGNVIRIGSNNVFCTAGPRQSSSTFYTCGHAPKEYFNPSQNVYINDPNRGYVSVGNTGSVIYGNLGDRSIVTVSGGKYTLPSKNGFMFGNSTYSYKAGRVGDEVEMHGGYSGITKGKITAVNQEVTVGQTVVKNLYKASYTCKSGDSGAAVFSRNIVNSTGYCYGVQSIGESYNSSGQYFTVSYFSNV